ncbi:hypothetical protein V2J09_000170 [Rumex salicifolius]
MHDCKSASTPFPASTLLLRHGETLLPSPTEYRALVGSLHYLYLMQPDVAFATNQLCQFMQRPSSDHYESSAILSAHRLMEYTSLGPPCVFGCGLGRR